MQKHRNPCAQRTAEAIARTPYERRLYEARMKEKSDRPSIFHDGLKAGLTEGLERGLSEGARSAKLETALKLRLKGFDLNEIQELTGLSPEEIADL